MSLVLSLLRDRQPLPDTAEFYPPPPRGYGDTWAGPEAHAGGGIDARDRRAASFFLSPGSLAGLRRGRERYGEPERTETDTKSGDAADG